MRVSARAKQLSGRVEDQIRFHPETHYQKTWGSKTECGSTACAAGWACELSGHTLIYNYGDISHYCSAPDYLSAWRKLGWTSDDGNLVDPGFVAKKLLGLNEHEAEWLFWEERTQEEVLAGLQAIRKGDAEGLHELLKIGNPSERYDDDEDEAI